LWKRSRSRILVWVVIADSIEGVRFRLSACE
jgi:hypothetical protein